MREWILLIIFSEVVWRVDLMHCDEKEWDEVKKGFAKRVSCVVNDDGLWYGHARSIYFIGDDGLQQVAEVQRRWNAVAKRVLGKLYAESIVME